MGQAPENPEVTSPESAAGIESRYSFNQSWSVFYENGLFFFTGGADLILAIEDVSEAAAREILDICASETIKTDAMSEEVSNLFAQLITSGVIELHIERPVRTVVLKWVGRELPGLSSRLRSILEARQLRVTSPDTQPHVGMSLVNESNSGFLPDLTVVVRTTGRFQDLLTDEYPGNLGPHMLIDLAYHHTISLGPLVLLGDSACLGCLAGRITTTWGDASPPTNPRITRELDLVAGVLAMEIGRSSSGDQSLINRTVTFDFEAREIKTHYLYKLPWCPVCGHMQPPQNAGSFALPWIDARG